MRVTDAVTAATCLRIYDHLFSVTDQDASQNERDKRNSFKALEHATRVLTTAAYRPSLPEYIVP